MSLNRGFHPLRIAEIRRETAEAVSILFEVPKDLHEAFQFKAGQHLTLKADIGGEDIRRNYSVCMAPSENEIRIAVKQMPSGKFSGWANAALAVGQTIEVLPPMGRFTVPDADADAPHYVAFAGGSGITPVISILKTVLETRGDARFTLLYGNRDSASIMFLEELAGLKNRYLDRLEIYHFLEDEAEEIALFNGRLDRAKCDEVLSTLIDPGEASIFFICGPGPMMDSVEGALLARDVPPACILIERFSTSPPRADEQAQGEVLARKAAGTKLTVTLDGRRKRFDFEAEHGNILDCAQAAGLPAPYACKGGVCTTCRAKVISGTVTMKKNYGLTDDEVAQGYVLTCQAVPLSDHVELSYDN